MTEPYEIPTTAIAMAAHEATRCGRASEALLDPDLTRPDIIGRVANNVVASFTQAVLWETVRLLDHAVADRLAAEVASHLDSGDTLGELAAEWRQSLDHGMPISETYRGDNETPNGYRNLFQRVLDR